jgi:uncharacterized membrane protein
MKTTFAAAVVMGLAALTGCNQGNPGGPGTSEPESDKHFYDVGKADNTFTLSVPSSLTFGNSTRLKQGGTTKVAISIKRGKNFDQDVSLKFEGLPSGVTIDQASADIKPSLTEANLTLTATDAAALGEFEIKVVGHPTSGSDATNTFKITVGKKETFTVSVPTYSTSVKQGETKAVAISIKREKNFDEDVTLKFADLPKGVTLDPASPVIKHGDTEAKLMLKSENDASLGDFAIKVTGHPTKGADASSDFNITVAKK